MNGQVPKPPREFLDELTDVSDRAAAAYGWQAGYAAAVADGAVPFPFDPVRAPAAAAKLYVLAVIDEMTTALNQVRAKYAADLSGDEPFRLLVAMMERVNKDGDGGG